MDKPKSMASVVEKANAILESIERTQELHDKQLQMYKEIIDNSILANKERIELVDRRIEAAEKRWANVRGMLILFMSLFLVAFVRDEIALSARPTQTEIESEYPKTNEVLQGFGSVIDDRYDMYYHLELLTKEQADALKSQAKRDVLEQIDPNYRTRSIK